MKISQMLLSKSLSSCLGLLFLASFFAVSLRAQQATSIYERDYDDEDIVALMEEPRHRTVLHEGQLYLLEMLIRPGDESKPHLHNQPLLLTYITQPIEGSQNGRMRSAANYAEEEYVHKIANPGPNMYNIIVMVHEGNGELINNDDRPTGLNMAPIIEDNWFRGYTIELDPGQSTAMQHHINPSAIVLGTEGIAHVSREDGITRELSHPSDWAWRDAGSSYQITNMGDSKIIVSISEGRLHYPK